MTRDEAIDVIVKLTLHHAIVSKAMITALFKDDPDSVVIDEAKSLQERNEEMEKQSRMFPFNQRARSLDQEDDNPDGYLY